MSKEGMKPSDFDASLPDNRAEAQATRDAARESRAERAAGEKAAKESGGSLWSSIFGGKDKK